MSRNQEMVTSALGNQNFASHGNALPQSQSFDLRQRVFKGDVKKSMMNFEEIKKKLLKEYQLNKNLKGDENYMTHQQNLGKMTTTKSKRGKKKSSVKMAKPAGYPKDGIYMGGRKAFHQKRHSYQPHDAGAARQPLRKGKKGSYADFKDLLQY